MIVNRVGVVGAGLMGRGVAQALAQAGIEVVLVDVATAILDEARRSIGYALKSAALFDPQLRAGHGAVLARIETTTDYGALGQVDFVIENTTEEWPVKEEVYRQLARSCRPGCILAANTSAISIARIAAATPDPSLVIGMHFMNPVPQKPVVEVIRSPATSDATAAVAQALVERLGKRAIVVGDSPGFVTNRILMLTINEAIAVVEEGVASARDLDDIFVGCFSHAMGPLATADLIGLDTILRSLNVLRESFDDPKFDARPLLRQMVESGRLGRKSGSGFFDYDIRNSGR